MAVSFNNPVKPAPGDRVHRFNWRDIDTVLLDMDGTLPDLAFDRYFWLTLMPARLGQLHAITPAATSETGMAK